MLAGGIVLQAFDPVAVELVDDPVNAVALQPAIAERAAVVEGGLGAADGEPGVLAQQLLEHDHAFQIPVQLRHVGPAEVQHAIAIVVQFHGEVRFLAVADHRFQPLLQRGVFRRQSGIDGQVPVAVEILALEVEPCAAFGDAVFVGHGHHIQAVALAKLPGSLVVLQQAADETLHNPIADGFPRMSAGADEDAVRCLLAAHPDDFQLAALHGLANGLDLHQRILADGIEEAVEIRQPIGLQPRHIELRSRHLHRQTHPALSWAVRGHRFPITPVL